MTALYIILGIILFFVIVFSVPVRLTGDYAQDFKLYASYLFVKINIFPSKEKKKPKKEKKPKEDSKDEENKEEKKKDDKDNIFLKFYKNQGFEATLELIKDSLKIANGLLGGIFKHVRFKELFLSLIISGSDAAETAIKYGKISSAVFPAMGMICSKSKVDKYDVDISPDFLANKDEASFRFVFSLSPIFITNAIVAAAFKLLKRVVLKLFKVQSADNSRNKKIEKKVKKVIKEHKS